MKNNLLTLFTALILISCIAPQVSAQDVIPANNMADIAKGKELAFNRKKGNCLACHYIQGGTLMGNTGPALIAMKARFPDKKKLYAQVYDARTNNELTFMPPFGAHGALSDKEVQQVVDWLYTL